MDPVRRALYDYTRRQGHPVTREQAAETVGVSRGLAAFHLDKLVEAGLLAARYQAPEGEVRGRGRTPKVYEPAGGALSLTIPQRRYELIAGILAEGIAEQPDDARTAAARHARAQGDRHGRQLRPVTAPENLDVVADALAELGYEPRRDDSARLVMDNCPFHALAVKQPQLICALNHAFVDGLIDGLGTTSLTCALVPRPGKCCVEVRSGT